MPELVSNPSCGPIESLTAFTSPFTDANLGLYDPKWEDGQAPHEIGRAQFGRISIANTDSEATALMNLAFDAAWRAVEEQTA